LRSPAGKIKVVGKDLPESFSWRGKTYTVRTVLETWKDTGRWWEGEPAKLFYRVETADNGLWEIYLDTAAQSWHLYKVYD
jgi:cell division septal protein FtsQ